MDAEDLQRSLQQSVAASSFAAIHGLASLDALCNIANIFHTEGHLKSAAVFYRQAYVAHSKSPHEHPSAHRMLQASLICRLKSGADIDDADLDLLRSLSIPFHDYISAMRAWLFRKCDPAEALQIFKNSFEDFHSGEEPDTHFLSIATTLFKTRAIHDFRTREGASFQKDERIPRKLFLYWDQAPPPEVAENLKWHQRMSVLQTTVFDCQSAASFLYDYYGPEVREMFLNVRHPAEAADILRLFVMKAYGGYWMDADLKLFAPERLLSNVPAGSEAFFILTPGNVVHSDMFGCVPDSPIMNECVNVVTHNYYLHRGLYIAYRTGPGVFARALNRYYYRLLLSGSIQNSVTVFPEAIFHKFIEQYPVSYKHGAGSWHNV